MLGADIDIRVIRDGKVGANGEALDVYSNFDQYGLQYPLGLLRMDMHLNAFRPSLGDLMDAIIGR